MNPLWFVEQLDSWVNDLATPLVPPNVVSAERLELREHSPRAVMVAKLVRAVSGLRAALVLVDVGHVTEAASLLRMVSDFCTEVTAVGIGLRSAQMPGEVQKFIDLFFTPRPRTEEEFKAQGRPKFVSRDELMKQARVFADLNLEGEEIHRKHRFLNFALDGYVHGSYESAMELCEGRSGQFAMRGHPSSDTRQTFHAFALLKAHEVVVAIEFTAAVIGNARVFEAARDARHRMDVSPPWSSR